MPSSIIAYAKRSARKPVGGFVFLTVTQLCLIWWAYRTRRIHLIDFRVWFAAHEMVSRRCQLDPGQVPEYTTRELHGLVGGGGGEHLRASIRRLEAVGLLTWSSTTLTFATSSTHLRGVHDLSGFAAMHHAITNNRRRVPVPRQTLRLIAGGCRATVIATMLGYLLRCLYYRDHHCVSGGWCKASWIAEVFRVDLRSIKAARKHLAAIGWLQLLDTPQTLCNRWGTYALISLSWTRAAMDSAASEDTVRAHPQAAENAQTPPPEAPPPSKFSTTELPPPHKEYIQPLQDLQHQQPARQADTAPPAPPPQHTAPTSGGPSGVERTVPLQKKPPPPTLRHIIPDDLLDTGRLLVLLDQAQAQGLIGKSDSHRLTFVSLAEHARVIGSTNPCGLFAALMRHQHWHYVTESDEDAASARLKQYFYGSDPRGRPAPPPPALEPPELSKDAFVVRELQRQLERAGFHGDAFGLVNRADPAWTRERWHSAVCELEYAKRAWQQANDLNRIGDLSMPHDGLAALSTAAAD